MVSTTSCFLILLPHAHTISQIPCNYSEYPLEKLKTLLIPASYLECTCRPPLEARAGWGCSKTSQSLWSSPPLAGPDCESLPYNTRKKNTTSGLSTVHWKFAKPVLTRPLMIVISWVRYPYLVKYYPCTVNLSAYRYGTGELLRLTSVDFSCQLVGQAARNLLPVLQDHRGRVFHVQLQIHGEDLHQSSTGNERQETITKECNETQCHLLLQTGMSFQCSQI